MAEILFNRIKIDSYKFFIPMDWCTVLDGKFNQRFLNLKVYELTGETIEDFQIETSKFINEKGISLKLAVARIKFDGNGIKEKGNKGQDYLVIQPSSKFLKESYFDGINLHNLPTIYNYLISLNVVWFSYESLLKARFTDVDFCLDFKISAEDFKQMTKIINSNVLPGLQSFTKPFNEKDNLGLQFNYRERATPTKPFLKFYHKSTELIYKSSEFHKNYLQEFNSTVQKGIGRMEITLKNSKFKNHYGIKATSVEDLFNLPYNQIEIMFHQFLPNYLAKAQRKKTMGETPTETMTMNFISRLIEFGESQDEILYYGLKNIDGKVAKCRTKKTIQNLLQRVNNSDLLEQNNQSKKEVNEALKIVGFYRD